MSLIVVLTLLIVISMLGLGSARLALMGERGARNDRDYQVAWQSAEAALMDAEFDMRGPGTATRKDVFTPDNLSDFGEGCGSSSSGNLRGLCLPSASGKPAWLTVDLTASNSSSVEFGAFTGRSFDAGSTGLKPAKKPRYVIEALPDTELFGDRDVHAEKRYVYRVTAMGFGPRDDIQSVVQMVFRKER
jgi:type IV pilus assembly protein PilX